MAKESIQKQDLERVEALLSAMTIEEKAGQLTQYFYFGGVPDPVEGNSEIPKPSEMRAYVEDQMKTGGVGSVLFVRDAKELNQIQKIAVDTHRLKIPLLVGYDVIHGFKTIFPVPIAIAASFDPKVAEKAQGVAAKEARSVGIHWTFAPMVDIARDPRWGRIVEGAGEDQVLGSHMAAAQVRGFQGEDLASGENLLAGPKHFVGYGASLGGRDYDEVNLSDSELHNVYLPPFKAAVNAGAENIMTAYMGLNGIPATANQSLISNILRDELGFEGFVVSDANAVMNLVTHGFSPDQLSAASVAINSGLDMEMAFNNAAFSKIPEAIESGAISLTTLDQAVRRILTAKAKLGILDNPFVDLETSIKTLNDPVHRVISRESAEKTFVLLRNEEKTLPLKKSDINSIAVIGPFADSKRDLLGPWCFAYDLDETITILQGIKDKVGEGISVGYAQGVPQTQRITPSIFDLYPDNRTVDPDGFDEEKEFKKALLLSENSDVTVLVLGEQQNQIGEQASRSAFTLPGRQLELLKAIVASGSKVILLVLGSRPLDLNWASKHVPAILNIWYPGTSGGSAVANTLFGDSSPAGRLPFTWVRSVGQVPMIYSHNKSHEPSNINDRYWDESGSPLYVFGHGLSYTEFSYTDLSLSAKTISKSENITVMVKVQNTGVRDSDEVVQLYIHQRYGAAIRPVRELKSFQRCHLKSGEIKAMEFVVLPSDLAYWNAATKKWQNDATVIDVWVGGSSTATLHTEFEVI